MNNRKFTLDCKNIDTQYSVYNERWDPMAFWVHIYTIAATSTWWIMEFNHAFLKVKKRLS